MRAWVHFFIYAFIFLSLAEISRAAEVKLPGPVKDYLGRIVICEDNTLAVEGGERWVFEDYLKLHWRDVWSNIQGVAPTDYKKRVVVMGCEALNDTEYLAFLQTIAELFAGKQIDMNVVESALDPSHGRVGFLAEHWQEPGVRTLMNRFKELIPAGNYLKAYPAKVLSGSAKSELDDLTRMEGEKSPFGPGNPGLGGESPTLPATGTAK